MSTLVDAVNAAIDQVGPGPIGVACSGGVDSMALAHATIAAAGATRVTVVTIDHDLVPTSGEVAAAVAAWARGQGATAIVQIVEVERRASIEAAARDARYAALEAVIAEHELVAMLLGHTARDQAETVLMRIVRGTGPAGLAGIPAVRDGGFVRPLLRLPRAATEAYVREHGLPTWDDPMNADPDITRVRIRDTLLPLVRSENPAIDDALVRLADAAREWLQVIDAAAAPLGQFPIDCPVLAAHPPAIRKRALALALDRVGVGYEAVHLDELDALVTAPTRGEVGLDVPGARVIRSYATLQLARVSNTSLGQTPPEAADFVPRFRAPDGYMLRPWTPGDRMCPLRLKGRSRKLSDLFIDAKVPREARSSAQVMVRLGDLTIVWAEHIGIAFGEALDLAPVPV